MEPADDEEVQMDSFWRKVLNQHPIEMNLETVTSALEQGAPVDGGEGCPVTPLQHAAHTSNLRLARILWDFNANLELPAELHGGSTAMHLATRAGNEDMVLLLVAMGARVDAKDYEERTPLHFAAEAGHDVIVDLLVSYGAPVDIKDAPGLTPAQYAAREGHTHILETLSAHGCNLHTLDQDGATLLHLAAEGGHLRTVCMLLVKGVSPGVEDANRCKAEDRAHRRGWTVVVDLLQHPQDASAILGQFALEERARGDDKDDDLGYPTAAPPAAGSGDYPVKLSGKMCTKLTDSMLMLDGMYLGDNIWPSKQDLNEKEQFALEERARGDDKDDDLGYPTAAPAAPPATSSGDYPVKLSGKMCPKLTDSMLMLDGMYLGDNIWPSKQDLNEKLVAAAAEVLVKEVEGVVEHGADLTSTSTNTDEEGLQAFHLACWRGQTEVVKKLLDLDVDPRAVAAGREGVHWAAFGGHVAVLRVLKDRGCDINAAATTDGSTPLHLAADNGNLDATRWLVQHGAQIHSADGKGRTAQELAKVARAKTVVDYLNHKGDEELLLRAAASGLTNSVKQLLEKGVNVNAGSYFKGQEGWRALHLAADEGHKEVVEVLLQAGVFLDVTNSQGMTPTQLAVQAGHLEIVQLLITKLPPIETETNGRYLVHWAAIGGYVPVLDYLLTKKYNLKALTSKGETALHLAADYGNLEAVKWLVKQGINFNLRDNKGHTAEDFARMECNKEVTSFLSNLARDQEAMLLEAANEGNVRAVTRLLGCGVNVDCERWAAVSRGRRAIHFAAHKGNLDVLQELFLAGAKREVTDMNGNTALHWAALGGQVKTMQFLKANNCKVAVVNCSSETPLHFAARANHPEALKWLLAQGVDRNIKAASGITAEDVAKRRRHHEAAEVLHNFGRNLDALRITG